MNKAELINIVSQFEDVETKVAAGRIVEGIIGAVNVELAKGTEISLAGLGKFEVVTREGVSKLTGEEVPYKTNGVKFKPAASLKRAVNGED